LREPYVLRSAPPSGVCVAVFGAAVTSTAVASGTCGMAMCFWSSSGISLGTEPLASPCLPPQQIALPIEAESSSTARRSRCVHWPSSGTALRRSVAPPRRADRTGGDHRAGAGGGLRGRFLAPRRYAVGVAAHDASRPGGTRSRTEGESRADADK